MPDTASLSRLSLPNPLTYWGMVYGGLAIVRLCRAGWDVQGTEHFPRTGPVIVVGNHINWFDPPMLIASAPRRTIWIAKDELEENLRGKLLGKAVGWLTVRRGTPDRTALKAALEVLKRGWPLGIFPEGTRSPDGTLQRALPGAAMLAFWSGAPVLPAGVWGSYGFKLPRDLFARRQFHMHFGPAFTLQETDFPGPARERVTNATSVIMEHIAALVPPDMRGVYGGGTATPVLPQKD